MSDEYPAITTRLVEQVWNCGELNLIPDFLSPDHIYLDPSNQEMHGHQAFRRHVSAYRSAFPDLHFSIEDAVTIGDEVTVHWTATGIRNSRHVENASDGAGSPLSGTTIYRFVDGKIIESWTHWDTRGMLYFAEMDRMGAVGSPSG